MWSYLRSVLLVLGLLFAGCAHAQASGQQLWSGSALSPKPVAPANGQTFVGFLVSPGNGATIAQKIAAVHTLETTIGRHAAIRLIYYDMWGITQANFAPGPSQNAVAADAYARGSILNVAWQCNDTLYNYANGKRDQQIRQAALALKAYKGPVMLRWFWEFNFCFKSLLAGHPFNCHNGDYNTCFDSTLPATGASSNATNFINAWEHIWTIFQQAGATNVAFVWCPDGQSSDTLSGNNLSQFLPPPQYVDWIGFDEYDRAQGGWVNMLSGDSNSFYTVFGPIATTDNLPIILNETGTTATPGNMTSWTQQQLFSDIPTYQSSNFPAVQAIVYFDADTNLGCGTLCNWVLDTNGTTQFTTFANLTQYAVMPNF